ncbi:MAG TPA: HAD-IIA family hydrolase [Lacipirellulaceae bacterium]|jgi:NagD protein|nr:HAD-IIA family hydrolase [Lacipirellulaceae bacterium]
MLNLSGIRHVVLDMDGTIYLGKRLFPQSLPFLANLSRLGISHSFLTNNCSKSRAEYVRHLEAIGISASPDSIQTSAHATAHYLSTALPGARRLFVLGTPGLDDDFRLAGFEIVDEEPDAVVVGFDTALTYDALCRTAYWINRGLPYIATHPDRICPTDRQTVLPDCAAICALLETATGRAPDAVPGKPNPMMLDSVFAERHVEPHEVALIGDRLYTDIRMARDAGVLAVLTLTGETKRSDVESCPAANRPDLIIEDLGELQRLLEEAHRPYTK